MPETVAPLRSSHLFEKDEPEDLSGYFEQCEQNRALLNDIYVVVPMRPSEGINPILHRMQAIWFGEGTAFLDAQDFFGGFIEHTRSGICRRFLVEPPLKPDGTPCRYLLMIDNDMEPPINLPWMLGRHGLPVVGVCAMTVDSEFGPQLCFSIKDPLGKYRFPCLRSGQSIPFKGIVKVGHVGAGAILIDRAVLEAFDFGASALAAIKKHREGGTLTPAEVDSILRPDIPFACPQDSRIEGMNEGRIVVGEDIAFCNQLRAKGIDCYVDLEAQLGHKKTLSLSWDETRRDPYMAAASWKVPNVGKIIVTE